LRAGLLQFNFALLVGIGEGLSSLSVCLVGKCADCGAIIGYLRAYRGFGLVLVLLSGERGGNRFKMKQVIIPAI